MRIITSLSVFACILCNIAVCQTDEIVKINHLLDTKTYYDITLDYETEINLPDSITQKFLSTLTGKVPQILADSILYISKQSKKQLWEYCLDKCKGDTVCTKEMYNKIYQQRYDDRYKKLYDYYKVNKTVVLAAGSWDIKKAIPVLEKAIGDTKYDQPSVLMALAKLGNDSTKQVLMEKYTLGYLLQNTQLDTIYDTAELTYEIWKQAWSTREGIETAIYLKSKEMLLNILDLVYIRGKSRLCIGSDCSDFPNVSVFVNGFCDYTYFHKFPNYYVMRKIRDDYRNTIWRLSERKLNKKEKKELGKLLSTEYRTKIRNQLRDWINENVNFE
jgi:hypothetical protein